MGFTDKFRAQHEEILALVADITQELKGKADAGAMRKLLSNLAGKVNFHLAMEDKALYPRLVEQDAQAGKMAARFQKEMGGLAGVFGEYSSKWTLAAIKADGAGFATETRKVLGALAHRMEREDTQLYPLADRNV